MGLLSGATNKRVRKLAEIHSFSRAHVPEVPPLDFSKFMLPARGSWRRRGDKSADAVSSRGLSQQHEAGDLPFLRPTQER